MAVAAGSELRCRAEQRRWLTLIGNTLRANAATLEDFSPDHLDVFQAFTALGGQARARQLFGGRQPLDDLLSTLSLAVFAPDPPQGPDDRLSAADPLH